MDQAVIELLNETEKKFNEKGGVNDKYREIKRIIEDLVDETIKIMNK